MQFLGKFLANFKEFYNEINPATLTGAIDVVVVRQEDGTLLASPFHVRFGKLGVLRSREKVVDIEINGEPVDIRMKLGETGEAFFVEEVGDVDFSPLLGTSPLPRSYLENGPGDVPTRDLRIESEEGKDSSGHFSSGPYTPSFKGLGTDESSSKILISGTQFSADVVSNGALEGNLHTTEDTRSRCTEETVACNVSFENEDRIKPSSVIVPLEDSNTEQQLPRTLPQEYETNIVALNAIVSGDSSKTDGDEVAVVSRDYRRKKKRRPNGKRVREKLQSTQSSDNSTTSEAADINSVEEKQIVCSSEDIFLMDDFEHCNGKSQDECLLALASTPCQSFGPVPSSDHAWSSSKSVPIGPEFHAFSDTDISPPGSPSHSRSPTPVKSDTEYEVERQRSEVTSAASEDADKKWSWTWGELPTPPGTRRPSQKTAHQETSDEDSKPSEVKEEKEHQKKETERSMLGSMFSFMRATKKARHNPVSEGIYLDDLNLEELDPEVAALYFPRHFRESQAVYSYYMGPKDEDVESGNGPSLPQSPHSVAGSVGGPKVFEGESDDSHHLILDAREFGDLAFSLCGGLQDYPDHDIQDTQFLQSQVTFDDLCDNPQVTSHPDLVVRMGGRYMNWSTACPQILSFILFQKQLPSHVVDTLFKDCMPKKEPRKRTESRGLFWFTHWRSSQQSETEGTSSAALSISDIENIKEPVDMASSFNPISPSSAAHLSASSFNPISPSSTTHLSPISKPSPKKEPQAMSAEVAAPELPSMDTQPIGVISSSSSPSEKGGLTSESEGDEEVKKLSTKKERYRKSLRITSELLEKLNLRDGSNEVVFSVTTAYQGTTRCKCHIFLWNYDDKIVVSDIDGTITKSDVLGHILPILGKDWAQGGVAQLFTKIRNNGYHFLYLSARAIGQAHITREYLKSIRQGDVSLPDGPLLLNPTSLIRAFHREVIERKPEEFKISCLKDVKALFPHDKNPFYAGYGNRVNDVWSYRAVGIPISRIFTINHRGELKHELTQTFQSSYSSLTDIAHHMFPPSPEERFVEFSSLKFWRIPLPDLTEEINAAALAMNAKTK